MDTSELFDGYGPVAGFDEMFEDLDVRDNYGTIHESFLKMGAEEIRLRADSLASSYLEQGVTFGRRGSAARADGARRVRRHRRYDNCHGAAGR